MIILVDIYFRSRDCLLLFSREDTGQLCQFCQDVFRDIKVDTDIKYDEEEKFALLNSFQQIVNNDVQLESDHIEEPDDTKTDPIYEKEVKSKPKVLKRKRKLIKKHHLLHVLPCQGAPSTPLAPGAVIKKQQHLLLSHQLLYMKGEK